MTMGQRILRARQEAGLSQRQLAGEVMTRNMLSALEHDGANPSVATLRYLSEKLGKPVSYFLGEAVLPARQVETLCAAREAFASGDFAACLQLLEEQLQECAQERLLLRCMCLLELAQKALEEERCPYARQLLDQCRQECAACLYAPLLEERLRLLEGQPASPDGALLALARRDLADGNAARAEARLLAMEERTSRGWYAAMGEALTAQKRFAEALPLLQKCDAPDRRLLSLLERCAVETGDFQAAYRYAVQNR